MSLKKIYSNIIPFKGYIALTVYPWVFIRKDLKKKYTAKVDRHETIHAMQQLETMWVFFLIIYGLEYIIKFVCTFSHKRAYKSVSFEQEAYGHQSDKSYTSTRRHYSWIKYVFTLYNKK